MSGRARSPAASSTLRSSSSAVTGYRLHRATVPAIEELAGRQTRALSLSPDRMISASVLIASSVYFEQAP